MSLQETRVIALIGPTCSGKTEAARALNRRIGGGLRSCGERVKDVARAKHVTPAALGPEDHREIDAETLSVVLHSMREGGERLIVEGTFLDAVLRDVDAPLVLLTADDSVRLRRIQGRQGSADPNLLTDRDALDDALRAKLYARPFRDPTVTIDTTRLTPEQVVDSILSVLDP